MYLPDCGGCIAHAFGIVEPHGEEVPVGKRKSEWGYIFNEYGTTTCEWYNENCPDECRIEHAEPSPDGSGVWRCPETDALYARCDACDEWEAQSGFYPQYPTEIGGRWYCHPGLHDFCDCVDCSEWVHLDDVHWVDDDYPYCGTCYAARREEERGARGGWIYNCSTCNTPNDWLDEYTENYVCSCAAETLRKQKKPVLRLAA